MTTARIETDYVAECNDGLTLDIGHVSAPEFIRSCQYKKLAKQLVVTSMEALKLFVHVSLMIWSVSYFLLSVQ